MKKNLSILLLVAMVMSLFGGMTLAEAGREPITLSVMSMPANESGPIELDTWAAQYVYERLGLQFELLPDGGNDDMKIQALLAADALPDITIFDGDSYIKNAVDAGMLVCLEDYIDKMPNAAKYLEAAIDYYGDAISDNGKAYVIPRDVGQKPKNDMLNWSTSIRWDLYQEIGAPEIETVWDYLDVLKQMQDINPVNEEGQKVYAVTAWTDWDGNQAHNPAQVSMLKGIDSGDQLGSKIPFCCVDFGTLELSCSLEPDSEYIEGLRWYFTANQMGILDPDSLTQTWTNARAKINTGRSLFMWYLWGTSGYNTLENVNAEEPTGFAIVLPTQERSALNFAQPIGQSWCIAVSNKSQHIDRCIEFIDFLCNPDEQFIMNNGPQGVAWDFNENGEVALTELGKQMVNDGSIEFENGGRIGRRDLFNTTPLSASVVSEKYGAAIGYLEWDTYVPVVSKLEQDRIDSTGFVNVVDMLLESGNYVSFPLANSFIAPLPDEYQLITSRIADIVKTNSWLAIYAESEDEFDAIVEQMYADALELGLEELMEYNQQAWDAACEKAAQYE